MVQLSKTEAKDSLKAGHPPAVKAGGKRVVKKSSDDNSNVEKETKKFDKTRKSAGYDGMCSGLLNPLTVTFISRSLLAPSRMQHLSLLLAGPLEKFGHDFPETPVSVRHSRVRPSMEKPHVPRISCIQQPRKC